MKLCKSLAILCNVIGLIILASVLVILIAVNNRMMYFNSIINIKSRVRGFFFRYGGCDFLLENCVRIVKKLQVL